MAITFLFCLLFARFVYVQVIWSEELNYLALDQWTRELPIIAQRGEITDRNGVLLADNRAAYTVYARSNAVKDKKRAASLLAATLAMDENSIYEKLTKKKASEVTIAKKIDKSQVGKIVDLALDGVYYSRDNVRYYPKADSLCQVVGFTSVDNVGSAGIEKYYEQYLAGKNGELLYETDLVGVDLQNSVAKYLPATNGYSLGLTIDYGLQEIVESALEKTAAQYSPVSAQCILLDVNNFEVLALANYPSYNLNEVPRDDLDLLNKLTRNGLVCDIYEPGSTFKIITSAINIEENLKGNPNAYSTRYVFPSSRTRSVDGTTVKCWSNHANGKHCNQTLAEALNNSCNPCFTDIALSIGKEKFYSYLTGLECSEEASDNIPFAFLIEPNAPLYGISSAEIIIEIPIEHGKTRYLMLKNDISDLGKLGAISASRAYISQLTNFFGGILVANGCDDIVSYSSIPKDLHIDLSQNTAYYYKENGKNVYTDVDLITELALSLGIDMNTPRSQKLPFEFEENGTVSGKTSAKTVCIPYSESTATELKFDTASGKYLLSSGGRSKLDMLTGENASFTNAFILFADMVTYETASGTEAIVKSETSGSGYYVTGGTLTEIRWAVDASGSLSFTTLNGDKLTVNKGSSYIGYYKASERNSVTFE